MQQIGFIDLHIHCIIGLNENEREAEQSLFVDLACTTSHYIDYRELAQLVIEEAREGHFFLLETLAAHLVQKMQAKWPEISQVDITIKKPAALPGAAYAFVRLSK